MKFKDAKRLHNEDEVVVKEDGRVLYVIGDVEIQEKGVLILCSDGNTYTHKELS